MCNEETNKKAAPESCDDCPRWLELKSERIRLAQLISEASQGLQARLKNGDIKLTWADYLKLLQIEKETEDAEPKEILVTWVDQLPTSKPEK